MPRLRNVFFRVTRFVGEAYPYLLRVSLRDRCRNIQRNRLSNPRYFFHTAHIPGTICAWGPSAERLPEPFLIGMLLHEYGHLCGGESEERADRWVFEMLGIPIEYRDYGTAKDLEWVDPRIIRHVGI